MVTRRCAQGQFLLSPSALVNQVFLYCLAYAAQFSGVQVVAFVCLSNHWHAIVTDVEGRLPDFKINHGAGPGRRASRRPYQKLQAPRVGGWKGGGSTVMWGGESGSRQRILRKTCGTLTAAPPSLLSDWNSWITGSMVPEKLSG